MGKTYQKKLKEKILKPAPIKTGHLNVILSKNNIKKHCYVHRLVAEAFIENPRKLPFIKAKRTYTSTGIYVE